MLCEQRCDSEGGLRGHYSAPKCVVSKLQHTARLRGRRREQNVSPSSKVSDLPIGRCRKVSSISDHVFPKKVLVWCYVLGLGAVLWPSERLE